MSITKYVEVEFDIDLDEFSDDELIYECKERQIWPNRTSDPTNEIINDLYHDYVMGRDITEHLRNLFDVELGRIIT